MFRRFFAPRGHLFATQFIEKKATTAAIIDLPNAAGIAVVDGALHVHDGETVRRALDEGDISAAAAALAVQGVAAGYKIARGRSVQVAASDTIATGLASVVAVIAQFDSAPTVKQLFVAAQIGDQAGAPVAGSFLRKTFKPTAVNDVTPIPATDFTDNLVISWIAIGVGA